MKAKPIVDARTILRVGSRHKPFSQLCNDCLRDKRLCLETLGALGFILSYPENWKFDLGWLQRERDIGRDQARRIINELMTHGYCVRRPKRNSDGKLDGYEYIFTDEPAHLVDPAPENPSGGKPVAGKPVTGKPAPVNQTQKNKYRDRTNKKNKQASAIASPSVIDVLKSEVKAIERTKPSPRPQPTYRPVHKVSVESVHGRAWLAYWDEIERDDLASEARSAGQITVPSLWPPNREAAE